MSREDIQMIPREGDTEVSIPVTLDYSGGRSQSLKSRLMWSAITLFIVIFIEVGIMLSAYTILVKLFLMALFFYVVTLGLRFFLLHEGKHRKELKKRLDKDYKINMSDFWGIYEIDKEYCYFLSGHIGMYIMLEKGAIVGKNESDEYDHYEAIADAYNILGTSRLRVCHIDMMDIIGRDDRIRRAHRNINNYVQNGMKDILEDIFRFLQKSAESSVTSYDIYLFMYRGDELEFETSIQKVLSCLMSANYSSYTVLDRQRIQSFASSLFNLHDFSVSRATQEAFSKKGISTKTLIPISLTYPDGTVTQINKTTEKKRAEAKAKSQAENYRKREMTRRNEEEKASRRKARALMLQETVSKMSNNRISIPGSSNGTGTLVEDGTIDLDGDIDDGFLDFGDGSEGSNSAVGQDEEIDLDMDFEEEQPRKPARVSANEETGETDFFDL